jgi:hypothetical protein
VKYFTKSRSEAGREERNPIRIILIGGGKEPSRAALNELIVGEDKFRENLVTVGFI